MESTGSSAKSIVNRIYPDSTMMIKTKTKFKVCVGGVWRSTFIEYRQKKKKADGASLPYKVPFLFPARTLCLVVGLVSYQYHSGNRELQSTSILSLKDSHDDKTHVAWTEASCSVHCKRSKALLMLVGYGVLISEDSQGER